MCTYILWKIRGHFSEDLCQFVNVYSTELCQLFKGSSIKPTQPARYLQAVYVFMLLASHQYIQQAMRVWATGYKDGLLLKIQIYAKICVLVRNNKLCAFCVSNHFPEVLIHYDATIHIYIVMQTQNCCNSIELMNKIQLFCTHMKTER